MATMKHVRFAVLATTLALASTLLTNCSPDAASNLAGGANLTNGSATFTAIYNNSIIGSNCQTCHSPTGSAYDATYVPLNFMSKDSAYATLIASKATGQDAGAACRNIRIVQAGSPTNSYLLGVVSQQYSSTGGFAGAAGCATVNHWNNVSNLSSDEVTAIANWITAGALNN